MSAVTVTQRHAELMLESPYDAGLHAEAAQPGPRHALPTLAAVGAPISRYMLPCSPSSVGPDGGPT